MKFSKTSVNQRIRITQVLLFFEIVTVLIPVIVLSSKFDFPVVLRESAGTVFRKFRANQNYIVLSYYIFMISSLIYIPISYYLTKVLYDSKSHVMKCALVGFGVATAIFQSIGFIRWIFVMPFLTDSYYENGNNKAFASLLYEVINRLFGMSIGEHLGFLMMGCWSICLGLILLKNSKFSYWLGCLGIIIGAMLCLSTLEHFGGLLSGVFGMLNFYANSLWSLWLLTLIFMFKKLKQI